MLAFHNGRFIPQAELTLGFHDAGFVFGATVTDFCRTYRHKLFRWPDHLARLRRDAEACFIPLPYRDDELTAAAEQLVSENAKSLAPDDDLALITFATPGPLGYMVGATDNGPPTVGMHTFPILKERYRRFFTEGVTLAYASSLPTWEATAVFADAKHRSRLHWWYAQQPRNWFVDSPQPAGAVPLMTRPDTQAPDTAIGAVLAVRDGRVFRPNYGETLHSISAYKVVWELCDKLGLRFDVRRTWGWDDLKADTERLLAGTGFGLAGVSRYLVHDEEYRFLWPGPVFTKLAAAWSDMVGVDIVKQFTE